MTKLTAKRANELLDYSPATGIFRWKVNRRGRNAPMAGDIAGTPTKDYWQLCIDSHLYPAHRVAFLMMTGKWPSTKEVDHANTDGRDNRWRNLRPATNQQNQANRTQRTKKKYNTPKGVTWDKNRRKFVAHIRVNYQHINLGRFETIAAAQAAYIAAAEKYFGAFARAA